MKTALEISGSRWKLWVCHVLTRAARDPLHLLAALRKVQRDLDWHGDRRNNRDRLKKLLSKLW